MFATNDLRTEHRAIERMQHIAKEDGVLFPMADRVLSASDQAELEQSFERIETEVTGPDTHERYHHLLDDLEREMGLVGARTAG